MYTVVEHGHYLAKAQKMLSKEQMSEIVDAVASDADIGEVMSGTGGLRKFRYAANTGRGKSAGARVVYIALVGDGEIHLIDIFKKNEKMNLSDADKKMLSKFVKELKSQRRQK